MPRSCWPFVLLALPVLAFASGTALGAGEPVAAPAEVAQRGEALLDQGDVEGAARLLAEAARAQPSDTALTERALVLKRVASLRRFVGTDAAPAPWTTAVVTLHAFYLAEGLPWLALEVDRRAHERLADATSAALLAETLLVLRRNQEVVDLLAARPAPTPAEQVYRGIALARLGRLDESRALDEGFALPADAAPGLMQDAARWKVLLGRWPEAFALLARSFEVTPPALLDGARARVRGLDDFAVVREEPGFAAALATGSAVPATCSGGTSCASCPKRGGCGKK